MIKSLKSKIEHKTAKICIIGLGYVGLPLSLEFAKKGFDVIGFDVSEEKVDMLRNGKSYISNILDEELVLSNFKSTTNPDIALNNTDFSIICVPTPVTKAMEPDLKYVISATETIAKYLKKGMFVILESTTYPGTTEEVLVPILEKSKLKAGLDFGVAYSPERIDPGNKKYTIANTPKIVGGITQECTKIATQLYEQITIPVSVSSTKIAETAKIIENVFRAVNIALVNELAIIAEKMNLDIWEVIKTASTKPYGFMPFYPGPGVGGHCIPVDPFYLSWKAKEIGLTTKFIELAGEINQNMPSHVVDLVINGLNHVEKSVNGSKIFILGMAYKKDINDIRNSPMIEVARSLIDLGAVVSYNDEYVNAVKIGDNILKSEPIESISGCDCVIIGTAHTYYDKKEILGLLRENIAVIDCVNYFNKNEINSSCIYKKLGCGNQ